MDPIFYQGIWRMDWGFGNPNVTAAFIAALAVGVWGLAYLGRAGFWIALVLFAGLTICLAHTLSRGGIVAAACGLLPVLLFAPRPWRWPRTLAIVVVGAALCTSLFVLKANDRLAQAVISEDKSVVNRLVIWERVPAMIAASPMGWGMGNAAQAYEQWFQPVDQQERYLHLVSTHLTWLVEWSWPMRCGYVLFWSGIFLLTWPTRFQPWLAVPFGIWISFFVAGIFSHVGQDWRIWIVPLLSAAVAFAGRFLRNMWPTRRAVAVAAILALSLPLTLLVVGRFSSKTQAHGTWKCVTFGSKSPRTWVVIDRKVFGQNFGKTLRRDLQDSPAESVGIVLDPSLIPDIGETEVIAAGDISAKDFRLLNRARALVLLNTSLSPRELSAEEISAKNLQVKFGEFCQTSSKLEWQEAGFRQEISGRGDYLGGWIEILKHQ
jgi:hypothetical protein